MSIPLKNENEAYKTHAAQAPLYDLWLDKHRSILEKSKDTPILDLGCGSGHDSLYLTERGYQVISCDKSEAAISKVRQAIPAGVAIIVDMLDGLPFEDKSFDIVIADLSLHYFKWEDTVRIVRDISRVLSNDGYLLCRLNSINDVNYGAGQGVPIEDHYYAVNGKTKRFFDLKQIESLFKTWEIGYIRECRMDRYEFPKMLWELAAQK